MYSFKRLSEKYGIDFSDVRIETTNSFSNSGIDSDQDYHVIVLWRHEVLYVTDFLSKHGYVREASIASADQQSSCVLFIKESKLKPKFNIHGHHPFGNGNQWENGKSAYWIDRLDKCHGASPTGLINNNSDFMPFVFDWRDEELYNKTFFLMLNLYDPWERRMVDKQDLLDTLHGPLARQAQYKVGIVLESRPVEPDWFKTAEELIPELDYILTNDDKLLSMSPKCLPCPWVGLFISGDPREITKGLKKNKLVCSFFSVKKPDSFPKSFNGYQMRIDIHNKYKDSGSFDMYGSGHNHVANKEDAIKDYKFSIIVENAYGSDVGAGEYYFTEKILDCFATKTVPIYCGNPGFSKWFDPKGVLTFKTVEELDDVLNNISDEMYEEMLDAVEYNYNVLIEKFSSLPNFIHNEYPFLVDGK